MVVSAAGLMSRNDYLISAQSLVALCTGFGKKELENIASGFDSKASLQVLRLPSGFRAYSPGTNCVLGVSYSASFPNSCWNAQESEAELDFPFLEKPALDIERLGCAVLDHLIDLMKPTPEQLRRIKRPSTEVPNGAVYSLDNRMLWLEAYGRNLKISSIPKKFGELKMADVLVSIIPEHTSLYVPVPSSHN